MEEKELRSKVCACGKAVQTVTEAFADFIRYLFDAYSYKGSIDRALYYAKLLSEPPSPTQDLEIYCFMDIEPIMKYMKEAKEYLEKKDIEKARDSYNEAYLFFGDELRRCRSGQSETKHLSP